jgi:hypothetical protein
MFRARAAVVSFAVLLCLLAFATTASAQSAIAGFVRDESGGALPGVTIEASSDALIEKSRSAVTDGAGNYRIGELRPGIYTIVFTLQGFQTVRQVKVELPAEFTLTANAEMKLGALEESIVVSGVGSTFVDVRSAARVQALTKDMIDNIPISRTIQTMGQLITGVTVSTGSPDVGGSNATEQSYMTVRGIPAAQNTVMVDGMVVNGLEASGAIQNYFNDAASEQVVFQSSDTTAANSGGGVQINMIPRSGGNRYSGDSQFIYRPGELAGDNLARHEPWGVANPPGSKFISDLTVAQGGPIKQDKLWFFATGRDNRVTNYVLNTFFDDGSRGYDDNYVKDLLGRLTWQAKSNLKVQGYFDKIWKFKGHEMGSNTDPETAAGRRDTPNYSTGSLKATWTPTGRLLIEGGYSVNNETRHTVSTGGVFPREIDSLSRQGQPTYQQNGWYSHVRHSADGASAVSSTLSDSDQFPIRDNFQASMSYVIGSHTIRGGIGWERGTFFHRNEVHGDIYAQNYDSYVQDPVTHNYTFIQPLSVTIANTPTISRERMKANMGIYAQDQWTLNRLTLNYGIRWEWLNSQVDPSTSPPGRFVPAREQPEVLDRPNWTDWAPRFSMVYDLFGNGRTALKYSVNRYNTAETTGLADNFNVMSLTSSTRQWTDLNGDDIAQGQRTWHADGTFTDCVYQTPGCEIYLSGPAGVNPITGLPQTQTALSPNFGIPAGIPVYTPYPRQYRIEHGIEVQHQITPRVGATFGWTRWDRFNNTKSVNQFRQAYDIDYRTVQFFNPIDGTPLPFLYYDITPAAQARQNATGAVTTVIEPKNKLFYDGWQTEVRVRPWAGAQITTGVFVERQRNRDCETSLPGMVVEPNSLQYCDDSDLLGDGSGITNPLIKHFKLNFSFPIFYGFTLGAFYQNLDQGALNRTFQYGRSNQRYPDGSAAYRDAAGNVAPAVPCPAGQAVCAVPGALSAPSFVATSGNITQALDIPSLNRDERLNQLDIKISRSFRVGRFTMAPTFEVFNAFNNDAILSRQSVAYMNTAGSYLRPNNIVKPRLWGFGYMFKW